MIKKVSICSFYCIPSLVSNFLGLLHLDSTKLVPPPLPPSTKMSETSTHQLAHILSIFNLNPLFTNGLLNLTWLKKKIILKDNKRCTQIIYIALIILLHV
jgi:hypothetical protein